MYTVLKAATVVYLTVFWINSTPLDHLIQYAYGYKTEDLNLLIRLVKHLRFGGR